MSTQSDEKFLWNLEVGTYDKDMGDGKLHRFIDTNTINRIITWREQYAEEQVRKVDRLEVIDETGRAYVKGSIYGSPVQIKLSFQDDNKTLKVFVDPRIELSKDTK
jgi:hypothetical protein